MFRVKALLLYSISWHFTSEWKMRSLLKWSPAAIVWLFMLHDLVEKLVLYLSHLSPVLQAWWLSLHNLRDIVCRGQKLSWQKMVKSTVSFTSVEMTVANLSHITPLMLTLIKIYLFSAANRIVINNAIYFVFTCKTLNTFVQNYEPYTVYFLQ